MSHTDLQFISVDDFASFRKVARWFIADRTLPQQVHFTASQPQQLSLFAGEDAGNAEPPPRLVTAAELADGTAASFTVPRDLLELIRKASHHRDADRWQFLYGVLFRVVYEQPHLLKLESDRDILRLRRMEHAVRRDAHKMKAFVRFRESEADGQKHYVAFHRPDHYVVPLTAPFFAERFAGMTWTILTPDASVHWDQQRLHFGPGLPVSAAPRHDELEKVWLTYYRSIFNPARIKYRAMVAELPVRHWRTLPETAIIPDILKEAPKRVETMIKHVEGITQSAADYIPEDAGSIERLREAAASCKGCPLYAPATQTVFGVGNPHAEIMLVGEQPGDKEDIAGEPFVGPAGKVLSDALEAAGMTRESVYLTNAVKHFKFEPRGKFRLHAKPGAREINACKPWLQQELKIVQPKVLVCLGATAAQAIIGRGFSITRQRGEFLSSDYCPKTIATYHPSAILRVPDKGQSEEMFNLLVSDLKAAAAA